MNRVCSKCDISKPLEDFPKNKNKKLGRAYSCKTCRKNYYNENKKRILEKKKIDYNSEIKKIYNKEYYKNNTEKLKTYQISSANTEEELIRLNHYTNFQPLCSRVNRNEKRDKICQ